MVIDVSKIFNKYKGKWVAFKSDQKTVVASGVTAREALKNAQKKGFSEPVLSRMPEELVRYIGFAN